MIKKVFIPNRGEIAFDMIAFFQLAGVKTVLMCSKDDVGLIPARTADQVIVCDEGPRVYFNADNVIRLVQESGCDALHPGYGFLATNPELSGKCAENGVTFIGPSEQQLAAARNTHTVLFSLKNKGVETVEISPPLFNVEQAGEQARKIGYPLVVDPSLSYFNYGIQYCKKASELENRFLLAQKESFSLFGTQEVLLRKYYPSGYALEVPFVKTENGSFRIFPEMHISAQCRFKKTIIETPAPFFNSEERGKLNEFVVDIVEKIDFCGLGSLEIIFNDGRFLLQGLNPFIPVGYMMYRKTYGIDFREIQLAYTEKGELPDFEISTGYGMEARIYAEDWQNDFKPCPGVVRDFVTGFDPILLSAVFSTPLLSDTVLQPSYLPYLGKLIINGSDREETIGRAIYALDNLWIRGVTNNIPFIRNLIGSKYFREARLTIDFIDHQLKRKVFRRHLEDSEKAAVIAAGITVRDSSTSSVKQSGRKKSIWNVMGRVALMNQRKL